MDEDRFLAPDIARATALVRTAAAGPRPPCRTLTEYALPPLAGGGQGEGRGTCRRHTPRKRGYRDPTMTRIDNAPHSSARRAAPRSPPRAG